MVQTSRGMDLPAIFCLSAGTFAMTLLASSKSPSSHKQMAMAYEYMDLDHWGEKCVKYGYRHEHMTISLTVDSASSFRQFSREERLSKSAKLATAVSQNDIW
jgi:hypothetical protein